MSDIEPFSESDRNGVGEDPKQHESDTHPQATKGIKADDHTSSPELQRSQRARKLMEKCQELHKEQVKVVKHHFNKSYEKWKAITKDAKGAVSGDCSNSQTAA